jgi:cyanophycinase
MKRFYYSLLSICLLATSSVAQALEYKQVCGNLSDAPVETQPAVLLSGGADSSSSDEKLATEWLLKQANGGDYLVLRSNGLGGQAKWICRNYSDRISSASEVSIDSLDDAEHPAILQLIKKVEVIWIAGGDQKRYEKFWKGTALAKALNQHIQTKPIGGTSAGMAILGGAYYAPRDKAVIGTQLLDSAFHNRGQDVFIDDLIHHPFLKDTLNETHLDRLIKGEDRSSRAFGFLAQLTKSVQNPIVIALNEGSFLGIDQHGNGQVWGNGGYILQTTSQPETLKKGQPLVWHQQRKAVTAYELNKSQAHAKLDFKARRFEGLKQTYWFTTGGAEGFVK